MAYLICRSGPADLAPGQIIDLEVDTLTLGREADNNIITPDGKASRYHAVIMRSANGSFLLSDRGSLNGTLVNGKRVEGEIALRDGDLIQIPGLALSFRTGDSAPTIPEMPSLALRFDSVSGSVFVEGQVISLSVNEARAFGALCRLAGSVCTQTQIAKEVWPEYWQDVHNDSITQLILRLRRKIEPDPSHPRYLQTIRGRGYTLQLTGTPKSEP